MKAKMMRIQNLNRPEQKAIKSLIKRACKRLLELRELEQAIENGKHVATARWNTVWHALQKLEGEIDFDWNFSWGTNIPLCTFTDRPRDSLTD